MPHFVPTSASWLNLIERWFGELSEKAIRRGAFASVDDLKACTDAFLTAWNKEPKPFAWTATVESILVETLSLPTNVGADSARLHQSTGQKTEEVTVYLFRGHYTRDSGRVTLSLTKQ